MCDYVTRGVAWTVQFEEGQGIRLPFPRFNEWAFAVTVEYDDEVVEDELLRLIFSLAGEQCPLFSYGSYNRFKVTEVTVV